MNIRANLAARAAALALCALTSAAAFAQEFPNRTVRLIMTFGTGGPTDLTARIIAQAMTPRVGQSVVVENRPGANGIIASEYVAKSPPDGYTLLVASTSHVINPSVYRKLPYDTVKDFASVIYVGNAPAMVLTVSPQVPAQSVKELLDAVRAPGSRYAYGSPGIGSYPQLVAEAFIMEARASNMIHVPFKGAGAVATSMFGNEIQVAFLSPIQATQLVNSGKIRALAVTSASRLPQMAGVPTMIESGFPGFDYDGGIQAAIYAPAGTPRDIIVKLNREIQAVMNDPPTRDRFIGLGMNIAGGSPEDLDRLVRTKIEQYGRIVRTAKIQID